MSERSACLHKGQLFSCQAILGRGGLGVVLPGCRLGPKSLLTAERRALASSAA